MTTVASVVVFWALMYAPGGILIGAITVFGGIPLYYRIRRIPPEKRRQGLLKKTGLALLIAGAFVGAMCGYSAYELEHSRGDYRGCRAGWSSWRIPLEAPYEMRMTGSMESGAVCVWQTDTVLLSDVIRYEKRGCFVAGETGISRSKTDKTVLGWFFFDCTRGQITPCSSRAALERECRKNGFKPPLHLRSVRDRWYADWDIVKD